MGVYKVYITCISGEHTWMFMLKVKFDFRLDFFT